MGRVAEDDINRIKREILVQDLAVASGIELKRHGQNLLGRCPFHDDKTPSLVITPEKNLWHCMGACQTGGSVIDWVMKTKGLNFREAVDVLRGEPVVMKPVKVVAQKATLPRDELAEAEALENVMQHYHSSLKNTPAALQYLQQRGLDHPEMLSHFKLGFADRSLAQFLPSRNSAVGAVLRDRLQTLGILRETGHEHFRGCVVFPIRNKLGHITEMYGRKIERAQRGTPEHLYLPGPHHGIFNFAAVQSSRDIILCESVIDALTFWCAGVRNVTCAYGCEGFTLELLNALTEYKVVRVFIAYDSDEAGNNAANTLGSRLIKAGLAVHRINFAANKDANAYALEHGAAKLCQLVHKAAFVGGEKVPVVQEVLSPVESPVSVPKSEPSLSLAAEAVVNGDEAVMQFGNRRWRIRGFLKNLSYDHLKVNVLCSVGEAYHVDTMDMYSARHRAAFIKESTTALSTHEDILKRDLGKVLLKLEELQSANITQTLTPQVVDIKIDDHDREAALAFLRDPHLMKRIESDFARCGLVGEESNKLVAYIATVSRKLEAPLAVVVQSSSAAGKSTLMDAVLAFIPEEERVKYSAMTGQSLYYMGEDSLKHKILAIVEEAGAEKASYALKLLQSEGELTIASTAKDPQTGRLTTQTYRVEGPAMIFLTTTAIEVDEELLNRCLVLTVNEDREQTQAIHKQQRQQQTLQGLLLRQERQEILQLHHTAQRLLRPLLVSNPYAEHLTFADDRTRTRRDQMKYLTLIRSIALLHQYQRDIKTVQHQGQQHAYIEVTRDDIALANKLACHVMGRSLDELPPQTRRFLGLLYAMVKKTSSSLEIDMGDYHFTRREILEATGWGLTQVREHLSRLIEHEFVLVHRGRRGYQFVYELRYSGEGDDGKPFLLGLLDLSSSTIHNLAGQKDNMAELEGQLAGSWRPHGGGLAGGVRVLQNASHRLADEAEGIISENFAHSVKNALYR